MTISFRVIQPDDLPQLDQLQQRYTERYPPRKPNPSPLYVSPYFKDGQNVLGAFDAAGTIIAFAPYFPQGELAWVEMEALPELFEVAQVKDTLWAWLLDRSCQDGIGKLCFQYFPNERDAIDFAVQKGAVFTFSIFAMQRKLDLPIPALPVPDGYTLRCWRMESEPEQRGYLDARNASFPEASTSLEEWQYFIQTPLWEHGVNMAAFCGDELAASVLVFWEPGSPTGSTEYVFTRPEHRGKGLSRSLLAQALAYLKEHELHGATLEVKAENHAALGVYLGLGYEIVSETKVYEVSLMEG